MGKILIVKGGDFSANAVKKVEIGGSKIFFSPFSADDFTSVTQRLTTEGAQYMLDAGGKCLGFMLPIVFNDETTVVVNTTDAYPGKIIEGTQNVVGMLYFTTMDLTNANITQIPKSTSLVDLNNLSLYYIKADTNNSVTIADGAKGGILYFWVNDNIQQVTPEIFNATVSSIKIY